jgi:hypothetical protein
MTCAFKVGDRVRPRAEYAGNCAPPLSIYDATVTEITERGFKYVYDKPVPFHPLVGMFTGGECYVPEHYELVPSPGLQQTEGQQ